MSQPKDENNQAQQPGDDLASELRELGQQLEAAVRNAFQSDRARQLQRDMSSGMQEIGAQLQAAFKSIQENPNFQNLVERGEQAVSQAQQSKVAQDFREALSRGITQLNDQLAAFTASQRQSGPAPDATPPAEGSTPATGETTRLDPDNQ